MSTLITYTRSSIKAYTFFIRFSCNAETLRQYHPMPNTVYRVFSDKGMADATQQCFDKIAENGFPLEYVSFEEVQSFVYSERKEVEVNEASEKRDEPAITIQIETYSPSERMDPINKNRQIFNGITDKPLPKWELEPIAKSFKTSTKGVIKKSIVICKREEKQSFLQRLFG